MLAELGLGDLSPPTAAVLFGGLLGLAFGILAQRSAFCLRRAVVGSDAERPSARGVWLMALAVSVAGTGALLATGIVDLSGHRFNASKLPLLAIVVGGLLFGAGMVLARGCASRLTVLAGSGNLRALTVLIVFAAVAHATLKGALAPVRTSLASATVDLGSAASLAAWPGGPLLWSSAIALALLAVALRSGARPSALLMGSLIGALAPLGWLGTGYLLKDEFDPIALESLALTSAASETLFWWIASSAIAPTFGVGFLAGVLGGSFLASVASRQFAVEGFGAATSTGNYLAGGALMGVGGVLAGGCTVGAGLVGVATLSVAAALALLSICGGAMLASTLGNRLAASRDAESNRSTTPTLAIASRAISL